MLCSYDDLYEPPTTIEIIFHLVYYIESKLSLNLYEKEVKLKAYMTMVIRYTGYVFESVIYTSSNLSLTTFIYMYFLME